MTKEEVRAAWDAARTRLAEVYDNLCEKHDSQTAWDLLFVLHSELVEELNRLDNLMGKTYL